MKSVYNKAKKTVADANIIVNGLAEGSDTREQNSAIADRIDHMIVEILPRGLRYCCLSCAEFLGRGDPGCCCGSGLYGPLRLLFGPLLYGVLFVPFVFAVLQQSARNQVAVDAFTAEGELSASSWYAAFLFLGAVSLYVLIAFTSLPPYDPRSARLLLLLSAVILVVWIQQALTFRYIMMRPELSRLKKQRGEKHKYRLCGRAYSSLNPHNMINYIYLTVILSEFFILASVCFHSNIPWKQYGARTSDNDIADFLQAVLPQALVGAFLDGASNTWLVVLVSYCAAYVMATGWVVYTRKSPASLSMAFVCDGLAGALYTTVVGRLLLSAFNLENNDFGRVLAMLGFFGFSTTAVFVATMRGDAGDARNTKRQSDVRFLPKYARSVASHPPACASWPHAVTCRSACCAVRLGICLAPLAPLARLSHAPARPLPCPWEWLPCPPAAALSRLPQPWMLWNGCPGFRRRLSRACHSPGCCGMAALASGGGSLALATALARRGRATHHRAVRHGGRPP